MTIPQLRAHAKEKGIKIPSSITRKADIVSHIQGGGKIPEKVAPTDVTKMTIPQLRAHAKEKGIKIPSSITADIVSHIQGGGKVAEKAAPQISTSGPLPENLTIAQLRQAAKERGIKIPSSVTRKADIQAYIEEGKAVLPAKKATATRVTTDETGKILSVKNLKTPESKAPIKRMVGESVTDPNTARIVPVPGRSKGDEKIVLPNDGFDQGAMHLDSNLGKLWVDLYHDQRSPNSFVNRVEKIGEDLGFGKASSAQTIDRLKALKTDAPDSVVADRIQKVIDAIDYPSKPLPKIPEGTPPVLADLIKKFNDIPLARRPGRGGMSDVDHAVQLAEKAGKLTRGQLATEMRKLRSFHHESEDGWAEMQRALAKAIEGVLKR